MRENRAEYLGGGGGNSRDGNESLELLLVTLRHSQQALTTAWAGGVGGERKGRAKGSCQVFSLSGNTVLTEI